MHELSIAQSMVQAVRDFTGGAKVVAVRLEIGRLSGVEVDSIRFCFDVVIRGTPLEGARLHVDEVPGHGRCRACGSEFEVTIPLPACACGSVDVETTSGDQVRIRDVEVVRHVRDVRV